MKTVIEKYKKLIFIVVVINCFALLVNAFNIHPSYYSGYVKEGNSNDYYNTQVYYFTNSNGASTSVWPFVNFFSHRKEFDTPNLRGIYDTTFNGVFYEFQLSSFLLYMGILAGFLIYKAYIVTPPSKRKSSAGS